MLKLGSPYTLDSIIYFMPFIASTMPDITGTAPTKFTIKLQHVKKEAILGVKFLLQRIPHAR